LINRAALPPKIRHAATTANKASKLAGFEAL